MAKKLQEILQNYWPIIASLAAVSAFALDYISMEILLTAIGLIGFSGLADLRNAINSSGPKTIIIIVMGFLTIIGSATGYVSPDKAAIVLSIIGVGAIPAIRSAVKKANGLKVGK